MALRNSVVVMTLSRNQTHIPPHVRVLIVDDNPQVRHDLRRLLELSGAVEVVGEAENGFEATRLAAALTPDAAVVDLEMPGMDGYEATMQIKTNQPTLRVIILSIHASPGEVAHALGSGADGFVVKGSEYQLLLNAILGMEKPNPTRKKGE
jgi:DNA-binding NarL/FixJ family response regulator